MELNLDSIKAENELEILLNSKINLSDKIKKTKKILKKITIIESSIDKFNSMVSEMNNIE
jgi:hypothetical protein